MTNDPLGSSILNPWSIWQSWLNQILTSATRSPMFSGSLYEPILPGGTFAGVVINENNSSDPPTERDIVSQYSYGKQLGQLMDAVDVLISELPKKSISSENIGKLEQLQNLKKNIDEIKSGVASSRFERVKADLEWLRLHAEKQYQDLFNELRPLPKAVDIPQLR